MVNIEMFKYHSLQEVRQLASTTAYWVPIAFNESTFYEHSLTSESNKCRCARVHARTHPCYRSHGQIAMRNSNRGVISHHQTNCWIDLCWLMGPTLEIESTLSCRSVQLFLYVGFIVSRTPNNHLLVSAFSCKRSQHIA